jgi:reverse transcriptase-like protein
MSFLSNKIGTTDNLNLAWQRLIRNNEAAYKNYFRDIYRCYNISINENLKQLNKDLKNDTYSAKYATKIYLPKKSGLLRTFTLLSVEDQIVYQAFINYIADKLIKYIESRYYNKIFGHIYAGPKSMYFYDDWKIGYRIFSSKIREAYKKGYIYTAHFDLTSFYDTIDYEVLKSMLGSIDVGRDISDYLCNKLLKKWTSTSTHKPLFHGHGIPQGPLSSGLLSEVILRHFDNKKIPSKKLKYFRYVDDIRLFAKNRNDLRKQIVLLDVYSKEVGLFSQGSKITIREIKSIEYEIKSVSAPVEMEMLPISIKNDKIKEEIYRLSSGNKVSNETEFKYLISKINPDSRLILKLLKIIENQPYLYFGVFSVVSNVSKITNAIYNKCLSMLEEQEVYLTVLATLINSVKYFKNKNMEVLLKYCSDGIGVFQRV